jgi:hypothetical protein
LRFGYGAVVTILLCAVVAASALPNRSAPPERWARLEASAWRKTAHFLPIKDTGTSCAAFSPPQPISERAPVGLDRDAQARVDFVVTRDGEVSSIIVLQLSSGDERDLIGALMGWRFRPAMCDGAPAESEAHLELQSRR